MTSISSAEVADFAPARVPLRPRSKAWIAFAIAALAAFAGVPLVANDYWLNAILIPFLILSLTGLGLNLLMGYAGQALAWHRRLHVGRRLCDLQSAAAAAGTSVACQPDTWRRRRRSGGAGRRPAQSSYQGILPDRLDACDAVLSRMALQPVRLVLELLHVQLDIRAASCHPWSRPRLALSAAIF